MIDAQELRLGNYVLDSGGKVLRIDFFEHLQSGYDCKFGQRMFIGNEEVHPMTEYTDSAKPIPLTEQWLVDFGFEKDDFCGMYVAYEIHGIKIIQDTKKNTFFVDNVTGKKLFVDVVHKLQNVIYELSGKELTKK